MLALPPKTSSNLYYVVVFSAVEDLQKEIPEFLPIQSSQRDGKSHYRDRVVVQILPLVQQRSQLSECTQHIEDLACTDSSCSVFPHVTAVCICQHSQETSPLPSGAPLAYSFSEEPGTSHSSEVATSGGQPPVKSSSRSTHR